MNKLMTVSALMMALLLFAGCGREEPAASQEPVSRMEDKAYVESLEKQRDARKEIMKRVSAAEKALAAAKAETPVDDAKVAGLEEALRAAMEDFKKNRDESQAIVAERIHREIKENKDLKKGNK